MSRLRFSKTFALLVALLLLVPITVFLCALPVLAAPTGAAIVSNVTETVAPASAASLTTAGGSFTTLVLNATTQTPRWKAYVGNVSGTVLLQNAQNWSIYSWGSASPNGEVYVSRSSSIDWSALSCADSASILSEEAVLNHSSTQVDNINHTFNTTTHKSFFVGTNQVQASTCPAISLYVNGTSQSALGENADFQEVLLKDSSNNLVYAALINNDKYGYNNETLDFEAIVPEDEYASTPHTYYFWLELS